MNLDFMIEVWAEGDFKDEGGGISTEERILWGQTCLGVNPLLPLVLCGLEKSQFLFLASVFQ